MSSTTTASSSTHTPIPTCPSLTPDNVLYGNYKFQVASWISLALMVFAVVVSVGLMVRHWRCYTVPRIQKPITRILFMVPVYSVTSMVSFYWLRTGVYMAVIAKCYESFVVWSFFNLILEYLGETHDDRRHQLSLLSKCRLPPPACLVRVDPSLPRFITLCKIGVFQYVIINSLLTFVSLVAQWTGYLCEGHISPHYAFAYVQLIGAATVGLAMFSLFAYYLPIHHLVATRKPNPFYQFLSVKFLIFFQFCLSFFIKALISFNVIRSNDVWTQEEFASLLTSFIILVEMVVASLIHSQTFTLGEFTLSLNDPVPFWSAVYSTFSYFDIYADFNRMNKGGGEQGLVKSGASQLYLEGVASGDAGGEKEGQLVVAAPKAVEEMRPEMKGQTSSVRQGDGGVSKTRSEERRDGRLPGLSAPQGERLTPAAASLGKVSPDHSVTSVQALVDGGSNTALMDAGGPQDSGRSEGGARSSEDESIRITRHQDKFRNSFGNV